MASKFSTLLLGQLRTELRRRNAKLSGRKKELIKRRKRWIFVMKRMKLEDPSQPWEAKDHHRLFSKHFIGGEPSEDPDHPGYVPWLFCFTLLAKSCGTTARLQRRVKRRLALTPINENREITADALFGLGRHENPKFAEIGTKPDPNIADSQLKELETQNNDLQARHTSLQQEY